MVNQKVYESRLNKLLDEQRNLKKSINRVGWIRLIVFVLIVLSIIFFVVLLSSPLLFLGSIIIGIMIFMWPIYIHQKLRTKLEFINALIQVNEFEVTAKHKLYSNGAEYNKASALALDIDLIGEDSLFDLINRCTTVHGNSRIARILIDNPPDSTFILRTQQAIKELSPLVDFRQDLIAIGFKERHAAHGNIAFESTELPLNKQLWWVIIASWPFISIPAFILGFYWSPIAFIIPMIGLALIQTQSSLIKKRHLEISGKSNQWKTYSKLFDYFHKKTFESEALVQLNKITQGASTALHQLAKLSNRWDQRVNAFAGTFMNALMLFDIKCVLEFDVWKQAHNRELQNWLNALGEIDCLNSMATFAFNHPSYCFPHVGAGKISIAITGMGHPLIKKEKAITNSIHLGTDGNVYVISGSNMSGKSTFLRAIGLNMVLAQAGLPVFAESMEFTPMLVLTSFRQTDSIRESTSYFMAELKRLKEIINMVDQSVGSLVLLDEILRGTNSEDKSHGSEALLEKLINKNAITVLATHDLKLGELETRFPNQVVNYCFESTIDSGELFFDYKIKRGIAKNKNATFLMKKMGIV